MRQNFESNGFEIWRLLHQKFALPDATRHVSLLTQLLDFKFNPSTFESDFSTWETIKNRYEQQVGSPLLDGVLVATLLNKTTGALQQHLRLNARTLQTYHQTRDTIVEYFRSKLILGANSSSSSSNGPAPMDIGAMKGKGKKGLWSKGKGKAKGKGKGFKGKGKGKGYHWNFAKGKGKGVGGKTQGDKGKSKVLSGQKAPSGSQVKCWKCGGFGHFESACPTGKVNAVVEENFEQTWTDEDWSAWNDFEEDWTVNAVYDGSWDSQDFYSYDDQWYDNSWDDSWNWYSYQDQLWTSQDWSAGPGTQATLDHVSTGSDTAGSAQTLQSPLPPQGAVSAVTSQQQPRTLNSGTSTSRKSPMANVAFFAAVMMSAVSPSSSLSLSSCGMNALDDMYSGVVDFRFPSSKFRFTKDCRLAPVVTFMNETAQDSGRESLFSVEQLGMDLNTTLHDHWLADHLVASTALDANTIGFCLTVELQRIAAVRR